MSSEQRANSNNQYYTVIDGTFRIQVLSEHPEAIAREWESTDGKSGIKYERIVHALFGIVESIEFKDGDYGTNLNIMLDKNEDRKNPVMTFNISTPYGEGALKLLPHLQPNVEYRFRPYSFTDKVNGKDIRGLEITTKDNEGKFTQKLSNFFYDADTKTPLNGYPIPEGDTKKYKSDDWKLFYLQARKFLVKYTEEYVLPRFAILHTKIDSSFSSEIEYPSDDINPEDIPF